MHDSDTLELTTTSRASARIALVADTPNWVFSRIAERIRDHLGARYDVRIVHSSLLHGCEELVPLLFGAEDGYDLVHFFWRESLSELFHPETWTQLMMTADADTLQRLISRIASARKTTWVCDHLFLDQTLPSLWNRRCLSYAASYGTSSKILKSIYSGVTPGIEIHELQDGVDRESFRPENSFERSSRAMVLIGWAGNSEWGRSGQDHKGLDTVIKPAIDRLRAARLPVRHRFSDRSVGWTPFEEMPQYYRSLDIFTCASINEGTPNTVLEAMGCGLPIVTTRVGIVDEAFGPLQAQFIVENRSIDAFEKKLRVLVEDPELRTRVGEENLTQVRRWDWSERIAAWGKFLDAALMRDHDPESEQLQLSALRRSLAIAHERFAIG